MKVEEEAAPSIGALSFDRLRKSGPSAQIAGFSHLENSIPRSQGRLRDD